MNKRIGLTLEEANGLRIAEIEYSDHYSELLEDGGDEFLLHKFNEAISILSLRIKEKKCEEEFTQAERDVLELVFGLIEDE